jgi:hypothetical protein
MMILLHRNFNQLAGLDRRNDSQDSRYIADQTGTCV